MTESLVFDESLIEGQPAVDYGMSAVVFKAQTLTYTFGSKLLKNFFHQYTMDCRIGVPHQTYSMGVSLVYDKSAFQVINPLINSLYWSCASMSDAVEIRAKQMQMKFKIQYASGSNLDTFFGDLIGLRRKYGEDDTSYRKRLQTYIAVLVSSGTKNDILSILDAVVELHNSASIDVVWPATAYVRWNSTEALDKSVANQSVLDFICEESFAAGVNWQFILKYIQYNMNSRIAGINYKTYDCDSIVEKVGVKYRYNLDTALLLSKSLIEEMDAIIEVTKEMMYFMRTERFLKTNFINYYIGMLCEQRFLLNYDFDLLVTKTLYSDYDFNNILEKRMTQTYDFDLVAEITKNRFYSMTISYSPRSYVGYSMDAYFGQEISIYLMDVRIV